MVSLEYTSFGFQPYKRQLVAERLTRDQQLPGAGQVQKRASSRKWKPLVYSQCETRVSRQRSQVVTRNPVDSAYLPAYLHRRYLEVAMKTRVQKWGNSLALRIPKSFAAEAGLHANGAVELSLVEGALVVQPLTPEPLTLDELLRGIADDNMPGDWDTGLAVGKEVW
jgi:antitoxin MazE